MQDALPAALQCKLLTVLWLFGNNLRAADDFDVENLTKLACWCPKLRTIIIGDYDLLAVQTVMVQVSSYVTVTKSLACLFDGLHDFPI